MKSQSLLRTTVNMEKKAEKLRKKLIREELKRIEPRHCQKYIRLVMDANFMHTSIGRNLVSLLESSDLKYDIRSLTEKLCIIWERSAGQQILQCNNATKESVENPLKILNEKWETENQLVRFISTEELEQSLRHNSLNSCIDRLKSSFRDICITLIFPSLPAKSSNNVQLERELLVTELQINHGCNILQLKSNPTELLELLKRFTKAIAEAPHKKQKFEGQTGFKKFLLNDNKKCVRVEGCNGLSRLWLQHLTRLPMVTLDIAESIRTEYSCPKKILNEIQENSDATTKLANIQIVRGAGVLSTNRRIGSALSNKLIKLYMTKNPNDLL